MNAHAEWADKAFPDESMTGVLEHLEEEIQELIKNPLDPHEFADCFGLLMRYWHLRGETAKSALSIATEKLEICKLRKWEKSTKNGSYHHIPQPKEVSDE